MFCITSLPIITIMLLPCLILKIQYCVPIKLEPWYIYESLPRNVREWNDQ